MNKSLRILIIWGALFTWSNCISRLNLLLLFKAVDGGSTINCEISRILGNMEGWKVVYCLNVLPPYSFQPITTSLIFHGMLKMWAFGGCEFSHITISNMYLNKASSVFQPRKICVHRGSSPKCFDSIRYHADKCSYHSMFSIPIYSIRPRQYVHTIFLLLLLNSKTHVLHNDCHLPLILTKIKLQSRVDYVMN